MNEQGKMNAQKTLVFVGAHPDDESFGIGGTLAQYAAAGVKVYYICGTRGEAGETTPESMRGYSSVGEMRSAELECARKALGLAGVFFLGYRDSGMAGSADNKNPQAMAAAPTVQVTGRIIELLRQLKPQVVVTFDPIGGYRHPDHIAIHNATVAAFRVLKDKQQYPEAAMGLNPQKLYFHVMPKTIFKLAVKVTRLLGRDPHKLGRNKDIDMAGMVETEFPVHAVIHLKRQSIRTREAAAACHASQQPGGSRRGFFGFIFKLLGRRDCYMRAEPPVTGRVHEKDLFEGIEWGSSKS